MTTTVISGLASQQHGMITRAQLFNAGLASNTIDRWVKAGRLILRHRGVYAVGHLPPSPHARAMAAVLACGPHAVLSHRSAAELWGLLPRRPGPVHVTAPTKHCHPGIAAHRARLSDADITRHYGIPVTAPARTLGDLARVLDPATLTRAVNDARLAHLLSRDDLPPRLREAQPRNPTRSRFEDAFVAFAARHRLPRPETNAIVAGYEVDILWRPQRLIAELDGRDTHENRFEADRDKDADLLVAGFRVVRVTWERLTARPHHEAARFRALLAQAATVAKWSR